MEADATPVLLEVEITLAFADAKYEEASAGMR
jgi:hypothetical protein